jgi:hypothetical protein
MFFDAMLKAGVPCEMHIYSQEGMDWGSKILNKSIIGFPSAGIGWKKMALTLLANKQLKVGRLVAQL